MLVLENTVLLFAIGKNYSNAEVTIILVASQKYYNRFIYEHKIVYHNIISYVATWY